MDGASCWPRRFDSLSRESVVYLNTHEVGGEARKESRIHSTLGTSMLAPASEAVNLVHFGFNVLFFNPPSFNGKTRFGWHRKG